MSTMETSPSADEAKFEKVLWRKQPFPDNFVPPSFLSDLKTNSQIVLPSFAELVIASLRISTRFLSVILFALLFVHLHLQTIDSELLLLAILLAFVVISVVPWLTNSHEHATGEGKESMRKRAVGGLLTRIIMGLVLLAVSPVLRTLTESTTSDSIWALGVVLFGLHLVLADYSPQTRDGKKLSDTLSFNAAISASVVLASRLDTDSDTFTLLALAILLFAPRTQSRKFQGEKRTVSRFGIVYVAAMATGVLLNSDKAGMGDRRGLVWIVVGWVNVVVVWVSIVCPWWIVRAQRWKNEIKGPWDPAEPVLSGSR